jgi:hypothetical protein
MHKLMHSTHPAALRHAGVRLAACLLLLAGALTLASVGYFTPPPASIARAAGSACLECHEVQAKHPVSALGSWHVQHASGDLCGVCHGGQPLAQDEATAHQGTRRNPMENPQASCAICHPAEYEEQVAVYSAELSMTQTARPPTLAPSPTATTTPEPTQPLPLEGTIVISETHSALAPDATSTPSFAPPTATSTTAPAPAALAAPAGINWLEILGLARGPLFTGALWFFMLGMLLRLGLVLRSGWRHQRPPIKSGGVGLAGGNILASFWRGLLVLPFIPWLKGAWSRSRVTYLAGGIFHLGLLAVLLLSKAHIAVWKELTTLSWPALPKPVMGWLSAFALLAMLALLVNRLRDPLLRLLSGAGEWLNWLLVFLPMLSGFILARQWWLPFEAAYALHMLSVDLLLVWIPLSRIAHFMFYFISRSIHGLEFGKRSLAR